MFWWFIAKANICFFAFKVWLISDTIKKKNNLSIQVTLVHYNLKQTILKVKQNKKTTKPKTISKY